MKIRSFFVLMVLVFYSANLFAAEASSYQARAQKFLQTIVDGQVDEAYDELFKDSPILKLKPRAIDVTKQQTNMLVSLYGKKLGFEFIKKQAYGNSIIRLIYIIKTENIPITFEIYFYKPYSKWLPASVNFEDTFALLTER